MHEDLLLAALMSAWRIQVCTVGVPRLVTVEEAIRIIEAARGERETDAWRRAT
jgi:hypothetical protein